MFDERETPIEEEKYFIARIYVPLSIESLGVHKFRISEKIRINPMFHELESPIRLLNNNIHGLSPSVGHHSLLFDQGFPNNARIQHHLADWNAIWQYFVLMRLYQAMLFILSIEEEKDFIAIKHLCTLGPSKNA